MWTSLVLHPKPNGTNGTCQTGAILKCMMIRKCNSAMVWWRTDLTPYYLFEEDATHFHQTCKKPAINIILILSKYKKTMVNFDGINRNTRIGGLFFDYCKTNEEQSMQDWFNFVSEVGDSFLEAYVPIVEKRKNVTIPQSKNLAGNTSWTLCRV
jgi:coproporphyrinogen III oxidase